jgi:hypothetical protein
MSSSAEAESMPDRQSWVDSSAQFADLGSKFLDL